MKYLFNQYTIINKLYLTYAPLIINIINYGFSIKSIANCKHFTERKYNPRTGQTAKVLGFFRQIRNSKGQC